MNLAFSLLVQRLRQSKPAMLIRRPYRRLFKRLESSGVTPGHPFYFLKNSRGVIHVGANSGQEKGIYQLFNQNVIWIEPIPEYYRQLQKNISGLKKQRAFKHLFAESDGKIVDFFVSDNEGQASSMLPLKHVTKLWPHFQYASKLQIETIKFDTFVRQERISLKQYDTLLLDTQGTELRVLEGAKDSMSNFSNIYTEAADFEGYQGQCRVEELTEFVRQFGFDEVRRKPLKSLPGVGAYFDVLYQRKESVALSRKR